MSLPILAFALAAIGSIALVLASIWLLYEAFRTGIGWGIACLLIPFAPLVFVIRHWDMGGKPFIAVLLSGALFGGGMSLIISQAGIDWQELVPDEVADTLGIENERRRSLQEELASMREEPTRTAIPSTPTMESTPTLATPTPEATPIQIRKERIQAELNELQEELVSTYQALKAQHTALDMSDANAVEAYNQAADAYKAKLERKQELEAQLQSLP